MAENADQITPPSGVTFSDEFKGWMREYIIKDNRSLELKTQLNEINERKKELKENILKYMKANEVNVFNTGQGGVFKRKQVKKTGGLNKTFLAEYLEKSGKLEATADVNEVVKYIYDHRPTEQVEELDRSKAV